MTGAFRIFSGWDVRQAEAAEVFAYSVREHASIDVHIVFLELSGDRSGVTQDHAARIFEIAAGGRATSFLPVPITRHGTTDFTYSRFLVPWLCGYKGRALFVDGCDMLCLGDVAELAEMPMEHALYVAKHPPIQLMPRSRPRSWTSMMLLDSAAFADRWTPETVQNLPDDELMRLGDFADDEIGDLPAGWNVLMGENALFYHRDDKLLHWSYLSDPEGGSWITRSGSTTWLEWRDRWRASLPPQAA